MGNLLFSSFSDPCARDAPSMRIEVGQIARAIVFLITAATAQEGQRDSPSPREQI